MEQRIVWMLNEGWTRKNCAVQCGVSESAVDIVARKMKRERDHVPPEKPEGDPMWTAARKLAVARRVKAKWCISHIASDLNELPGPPITPRDVIAFSRGEVAA